MVRQFTVGCLAEDAVVVDFSFRVLSLEYCAEGEWMHVVRTLMASRHTIRITRKEAG
jgi:hypothetical protein